MLQGRGPKAMGKTNLPNGAHRAFRGVLGVLGGLGVASWALRRTTGARNRARRQSIVVLDDPRTVVVSIPVPSGWSAEQSWETILRGDRLKRGEWSWEYVMIEAGRLIRSYEGEERL